MSLIFLYGPAGVGKLTVAREVQSLTGYRLFHNHLVVDLLLSVFEFGTPPFVALREEFWLSTLRHAAREDVSLIFTFAPENTVHPTFPTEAEAAVTSEGGRVMFVSLHCPEDELERRIADPSRKPFHKLQSAEQYRQLRDAGAFSFPKMRADLEIDTGVMTPKAAAQTIVAALAERQPPRSTDT